MSNSTTSPRNNVVDLAVTMRGDIGRNNLPDYIAAVSAEHARDLKVTYGSTVVYMAARDLTEKFVGNDYAAKVGKSPAYVSTLAGLALAVDRGITPHGSAIMAKRWAALVQNMTKDVRAILKDKKASLKSLDAVLFATADKKKADRKKAATTDSAEDRTERATDAKANTNDTVGNALDALDGAYATLLHALDNGKVTPAQRERFDAIHGRAVAAIAAHDADRGAATPPKVVRSGKKATAAA